MTGQPEFMYPASANRRHIRIPGSTPNGIHGHDVQCGNASAVTETELTVWLGVSRSPERVEAELVRRRKLPVCRVCTRIWVRDHPITGPAPETISEPIHLAAAGAATRTFRDHHGAWTDAMPAALDAYRDTVNRLAAERPG